MQSLRDLEAKAQDRWIGLRCFCGFHERFNIAVQDIVNELYFEAETQPAQTISFYQMFYAQIMVQ